MIYRHFATVSDDGKAFIIEMSRKTFFVYVLLMLSGVKVMIKKLLYLLLTCVLFSCGGGTVKYNKVYEKPIKSLSLKYAKGFKLDVYKEYKRLSLFNPNDTTKLESEFILLEKGKKVPENLKNIPSIIVPIERAVCLTLTQLSYIVELDAIDKLCGMNSSRFLFNKKVREKIKEGSIELVGRKGNFKPEILMAEDPDVIFVSPFKEGGYDNLKEVGIKLVPVYAYNENHPLARAEWLKFMALFTGDEVKADSLFSSIDKEYNSLKALTSKIKKRPVVFSGECKSGVWYAVGGKSYLAHYFEDAGADYVWKDNLKAGALRMDYESVYAQAAKADYWRILNSHKGDFSYEILKEKDERYADFEAFSLKKIVYCNMRKKAFYETSPVKPHIILADYINAFHPNLLKGYKPRYYSILK